MALLAKILEISPIALLDGNTTHTNIYTPDEIAHLTKYRALDENGRELVDSLLDTLYTQRFNKSTELSEETSAS